MVYYKNKNNDTVRLVIELVSNCMSDAFHGVREYGNGEVVFRPSVIVSNVKDPEYSNMIKECKKFIAENYRGIAHK